MKILQFAYNFSAGYLLLMLSFTLTDSIKFQLIVFNSTCLSMVLLPCTSKPCCIPFLSRLLSFWERLPPQLLEHEFSLLLEILQRIFLEKASESLSLLSCSNLLICILLVLGPVCEEFSYWLKIGINAD